MQDEERKSESKHKSNSTFSLVKIDPKNSLRNSKTFMQLTKEHGKYPFMEIPPPPAFF